MGFGFFMKYQGFLKDILRSTQGFQRVIFKNIFGGRLQTCNFEECFERIHNDKNL